MNIRDRLDHLKKYIQEGKTEDALHEWVILREEVKTLEQEHTLLIEAIEHSGVDYSELIK